MRKKKEFRPAALDGMEARIAPSSFGSIASDVSKVAHHYEHVVGTEYDKLDAHHGDHHAHDGTDHEHAKK